MNQFTARMVKKTCKYLLILSTVSLVLILLELSTQQTITSDANPKGHSTDTQAGKKLDQLAIGDPAINISHNIDHRKSSEQSNKSHSMVDVSHNEDVWESSKQSIERYPVVDDIPRHNEDVVHGRIFRKPNKTSDVDRNTRRQRRMFISEDVLKGVIKILNEDIYILSAVAIINHRHRSYDGVVLTGWDGRQSEKKTFEQHPFCCNFVYNDGRMLTVVVTTKPRNIYVTRYTAEQYTCPLRGGQPSHVLLEKCNVNIMNAMNTTRYCNDECLARSKYLQIIYPEFQEGKLAICTKIAYGTTDIQSLIEWFEIQRLLGVHKVFSLIKDNVDQKLLKVLQYYQSTGFSSLYPMQFVRRVRTPYTHNRPWYIAEGDIARHHCFAVMSGYSFASIIDFDEIFVPKKEMNLLQMLKKNLILMKKNPAAFRFSNEIFLTDDTMPVNASDMFLGRHLHRLATLTPTTPNRTKVIYIPNVTVWTEDHFIHPMWNYKSVAVPSDVATFHHYRRSCPDYLECKNQTFYYDNSISKYLPQLDIMVKAVSLKTGFV